jgi:hypothetical protein
MGSAFNGWTGQAKGGRKPAWMAGESSRLCRKYGPKVEEVAAVERREALPCASVPGDPGICRGLLTTRLAALPPPSPHQESEDPEPPIHVKIFAGSDDARPEKGAV